MDCKINDPRLRRHELNFLQVSDLPSVEELQTFYSQKYYQSERGNYRKEYPEDELAYFEVKTEQRAEMAARIRGSSSIGRMLDVGCGEGFALKYFKRKGWDVHGIDFSVEGLKRMNPDLVPHVKIGNMYDLLKAALEEGERYDLIWLTNVLEHVIDPVGLLERLRRLISPEGCAVITVPNDGSALQEMLLDEGNISERFWIALPDHLSYFDATGLRSIAEGTGWVCQNIMGDFPIDLFLLHPGSNYVQDGRNGPTAHRARIRLELLIARNPIEDVNAFYSALARVGLGRDLTAFLTPKL